MADMIVSNRGVWGVQTKIAVKKQHRLLARSSGGIVNYIGKNAVKGQGSRMASFSAHRRYGYTVVCTYCYKVV